MKMNRHEGNGCRRMAVIQSEQTVTAWAGHCLLHVVPIELAQSSKEIRSVDLFARCKSMISLSFHQSS
jgi:hypothetical protein